MRFKEDLDVFFKGVFSSDCLLNDSNVTIDCILNKSDDKSNLGGLSSFDVVNAVRSAYFKEVDIDKFDIKKNTVVTINNVVYVIKDVIRSDGIALCSLNFN